MLKISLKEGLEGILIINGIDSKENNEYIKLMNWLFFGYSGVEILENKFLDPDFNEMVFFLR